MAKILKIGTIVTLTNSHLEWLTSHADECYNFPLAFIKNPKYAKDEINSYLMTKYSHPRCLTIEGVIVGNNAIDESDYESESFAYLVWCVNEIGEDITYIDPEHLEVLE